MKNIHLRKINKERKGGRPKILVFARRRLPRRGNCLEASLFKQSPQTGKHNFVV
jgi:hypothetical protein